MACLLFASLGGDALAAAGAASLVTVTPCRIFDSRSASPLQDGVSLEIPVAGACGIASDAAAVALNVTAVGPSGDGTLEIVAADGSFSGSSPAIAALSFRAGVTRSMSLQTQLSAANGRVKALASIPGGGTTDLVLDVAGFYLVVPTLVAVNPSSGAAAGGTGVSLTGTVLTGATAVTFGGVAATSVNVVDSTTVTAVTPAHAVGAVDVVVATPDGNATLVNGYTYVTTAVGQPVGGGVVAGLGGGLQNLIAAVADNSSGIAWGGFGTVTGAQSDTDGAANTATAVAALGAGLYAAQLCGDYEVDSQGNTPCQVGNTCYNDWFLPAKDQLSELFTNRVAIGGFAAAVYSSSTEFSGAPALDAWVEAFGTGSQLAVSKSTLVSARCVRAFAP